jgi:hypothetical protein
MEVTMGVRRAALVCCVFLFLSDRVMAAEIECTSDTNKAPAEWQCDPTWYDAGDGCDCGCAVHDPDCDSQEQPVYVWCEEPYNACRIDDGQCIMWNCAPELYGSQDGCDCGCGSQDPDCEDATLPVNGCKEIEVCIAGECAEPKL